MKRREHLVLSLMSEEAREGRFKAPPTGPTPQIIHTWARQGLCNLFVYFVIVLWLLWLHLVPGGAFNLLHVKKVTTHSA